jgi:hypothetical protein
MNIEPNGVSDDRRRKLVARKRDRHAPSYQANHNALPFFVTGPLALFGALVLPTDDVDTSLPSMTSKGLRGRALPRP